MDATSGMFNNPSTPASSSPSQQPAGSEPNTRLVRHVCAADPICIIGASATMCAGVRLCMWVVQLTITTNVVGEEPLFLLEHINLHTR
jgi:hypothetical protein